MQRYIEPSLKSFKWNTNFWVYIIIYIHSACLLLGIMHFTLFMNKP